MLYSPKYIQTEKLRAGDTLNRGRENAMIIENYIDGLDYNHELELNINAYFIGDERYKGAGKSRLSVNSPFFDGVVWWTYLRDDDGRYILYYQSDTCEQIEVSDMIIVYSPYKRQEQAAAEPLPVPRQTPPPYYARAEFDFSDGVQWLSTKQMAGAGNIAINENCLIMEGVGRLSYAFLTFFKDERAEGRGTVDRYTVSPPSGANQDIANGNAAFYQNLINPDGFTGKVARNIGNTTSPLKFVFVVENNSWRVYYSIGTIAIADDQTCTLNNKYKGEAMREKLVINAVYI